MDLKSFDDRHYRQLGGRLEPILRHDPRGCTQMGVWLEIVTLLIPGFNNSRDEIERLTSFIAGVSPDIPWHVTAFHKDYRMNGSGKHDAGDADRGRGDRSARTACATFTPATFPDSVGDLENTRCHNCRAMLVERYGYFIQAYRIDRRRRLPGLRHTHPGPMGKSVRRTDCVLTVPSRTDGCGCCDGADRAASNVMTEKKTVAVIGASSNRNKFGNKALRAFERQGYTVHPDQPERSRLSKGTRPSPRCSTFPGAIDMAYGLHSTPHAGVGVMEQLAEEGRRRSLAQPGSRR